MQALIRHFGGGGKKGLLECLPDGVGALAVAPCLPPARHDSVEGEAAPAHEAGLEGDGFVWGRGTGAWNGGCGLAGGGVGVDAVAGVVGREVVGWVPSRWWRRTEGP